MQKQIQKEHVNQGMFVLIMIQNYYEIALVIADSHGIASQFLVISDAKFESIPIVFDKKKLPFCPDTEYLIKISDYEKEIFFLDHEVITSMILEQKRYTKKRRITHRIKMSEFDLKPIVDLALIS